MGEQNLFKNNREELSNAVEIHLYHLDNYIHRTPSEFNDEPKFLQLVYIKHQFILNLLRENLMMEEQFKQQ